MKKIWLAASAFYLAFIVQGCTFTTLQDGLTALEGRPVDEVIETLGLPDSEQTIADRRILIWHSENSGIGMVPVEDTSKADAVYKDKTGVKTANYSWTKTTYVPQMYNYQCTIKGIMTAKNTVERFQFEGDPTGCEKYAFALRELAEQMKKHELTGLKDADSGLHDRALASALTSELGKESTWKNPANGHSGAVTPVQEGIETATKRLCRIYKQTITADGKTETAFGTACRDTNNMWVLTN